MTQTAEEYAGWACTHMHDHFSNRNWNKELPTHICQMLGENEWHRPLWQRRAMPPNGTIFELERFEDYLMFGFRRGLGFESWFTIDNVLKTQGRDGAHAIELLKREIPDYQKKVEFDRNRNNDAKADRLAKHGEIGGGHGRVDNINSGRTSGGTSAAYLIARLKRDAPQIAERYARGEFRSVRAAALAAGLITEQSRLERMLREWDRLSTDDRRAFLKRVSETAGRLLL